MEMSLTGGPRIGSPAARAQSRILPHCGAAERTAPEMDLGDAAVIAGNEAVEDLGSHMRARRSIRPMIPKSIAPISRRQREQIAVMQIGVEEAVDHGLAQKRADERRRELPAVMASLFSASRSLSLIRRAASVSARRAVRRQSIPEHSRARQPASRLTPTRPPAAGQARATSIAGNAHGRRGRSRWASPP